MTPKADRHLLPALGGRGLALAPGLSLVMALAITDAALQPRQAIIGIVVLAPLLTILVGEARDVVTIGAAAVAACLLSALWHNDVALATYVYRLGVVLAATALAVMLARGRTQVGRDRERFALLSEVAEIADGTLNLEDTVAALNALVVPRVADICIVDAVSHGELRRLAVHGLEQGGDEAVAALATRPPSTSDVLGDPEQARLVRVVDDAVLRRIAVDDDDLGRLRALGVTSAVVVPLRARPAAGLADAARHPALRPPLRQRRRRVRQGARGPSGARARQRRAVLRAGDDRGPAHRRAVDARRGRHRPATRRIADVRQRRGGADARFRITRGAAVDAGRAGRRPLCDDQRGRLAAA